MSITNTYLIVETTELIQPLLHFLHTIIRGILIFKQLYKF